MAEPGAYYTEWNKSERGRQILYINTHTHTHTHTHIYIYIYMEFRKMILMILHWGQHWRHRCLDSMGEGEGGMICENSIETRILSTIP